MHPQGKTQNTLLEREREEKEKQEKERANPYKESITKLKQPLHQNSNFYINQASHRQNH